MTKYLISFRGSAMDVAEADGAEVGEASHAVMREAKRDGVYVFGGGINADVAPLRVAADGTVSRNPTARSDLQEVRRSAPTEGQDSALISGWHCRRIHPEHGPHVAVRVGEVPGVHEAMVLNRVHVGLPPVRRGGVVHRIDGVTAFHGQ